MAERIYLCGKDEIEPCENNLVSLTLADGRRFEALEPRRLFPVSALDKYVTLLDCSGGEIAVIKDLSDLNSASKRAVCDSLDDYYLVPMITRIIAVSEKYGTLRWTVETDRGIKSFDIRNRNHDIKVYADGRVRVRDSDDNRYTIEDYRALDSHSRTLMIAEL